METKIVYLFPPEQWRYWRESTIGVDIKSPEFKKSRHALAGPNTATMAYSLDVDGKTVRVWWVFPELSHIDGVDPPREMETTPFEFVHPARIKIAEPSPVWLPSKDPQRLHARLEKRPERILRRWAEFEYKHRPRVRTKRKPCIVVPLTRWQRAKAWLGRIFT